MPPDPDFPESRPAPRRRPSLWRILSSALLLAASVGLALRTYRQAVHQDSINASPDLAAFADPAEQERRQRDVMGTFATGAGTGERTLTIRADGTLRFAPVGSLAAALEVNDTYQLGRHNNRTGLATTRCGLIEVIDIDRLTCFGDVYERTR